MKTVLVVGRDWKFRALLRALLLEEGYAALGFETLEEAAQLVFDTKPAALILDTTAALSGSFQPSLATLAEHLPVLVVAAADESFDFAQDTSFEAGAARPNRARVLRRPLRLEDVVAAVKSLVPPDA